MKAVLHSYRLTLLSWLSVATTGPQLFAVAASLIIQRKYSQDVNFVILPMMDIPTSTEAEEIYQPTLLEFVCCILTDDRADEMRLLCSAKVWDTDEISEAHKIRKKDLFERVRNFSSAKDS
jgi:hypothetical protein